MQSSIFEQYLEKGYKLTGIKKVKSVSEAILTDELRPHEKKKKVIVAPPDAKQGEGLEPIQPNLSPEQIGDVDAKTAVVQGWIARLNERFKPLAQFDLKTTIGESGVKDITLSMTTANGVEDNFFHVAAGEVGEAELAEVVKLAESQLGQKSAMGESEVQIVVKQKLAEIKKNRVDLLGEDVPPARKKPVFESNPKDLGLSVESIEKLVPLKAEKGWTKKKRTDIVMEFELTKPRQGEDRLFLEVVTPELAGSYKKLKPGYTIMLLNAETGKSVKKMQGITEELEMRRLVREVMK